MRARRLRALVQRCRGDESGIVIVWMTVVLVLLLSVAAFAVDLVHAYVEAERAQNAADAAALAGATLVPGDTTLCSAPSVRAAQLATDNGFTDHVDGATVQPTCSSPNEMTVTVKRTFDTFFARIMGFDKLTVARTGVADYDAPVAMGSAANFVGNIPDCPVTHSVPTTATCLNTSVASPNANLWANIQGQDGESRQGNALTTKNCNGVTDECISSLNHQYRANGEFFEIDNGVNQNLDVYVYDGGFAHTSLDCQTALNTADWPAAGYVGSHYPTPTASNRDVTNNSYCSGDSSFGSGEFTTEYTISAPDGTPVSGCDTGAIPGYGFASDPTHDVFNDPTARQYFRQWKKICTIPGALAGGEYKLNVQAGSGTGTNQFSIMVLGSIDRTKIHVFSRESLPLLAKHLGNGNSQFFMARVVPSDRQRRIDLSFFDLGDNSFSNLNGDSQGTLKITAGPGVDPKFQAYLNTSTSACDYSAPPANTTSSRSLDAIKSGSFTPTNLQCQVQYDSSFNPSSADGIPPATNTWDARWVVLRVTLPPRNAPNGYQCTSPAFDQCWLMVNIDTTGSASLTDATTWTAHLEGGPVRLTG
jgi:Flp pilus assembly protein TadG